jgi:hypothetical protein
MTSGDEKESSSNVKIQSSNQNAKGNGKIPFSLTFEIYLNVEL